MTEIRWSIRSTLPGRVRLVCPDLIQSPLLRHHCAITLTCCRWITGFRINSINGSLVLYYAQHRKKDLDQILKESLTIPENEGQHLHAFAEFKAQQWLPNPASTRAMRHGLCFGGLVIAEAILPIPAFIMIGGTILAMLPVVKEVLHHWRQKHQLPPEALELAFSGILLSQGHASETLLDLVLGDSSDAMAGMAAGESELHAKPREFFNHISNAISLEIADEQKSKRLLKDVRTGDRYHANANTHIILASVVREGEIIVINRLFNGDWKPQKLGPKAIAYPGALIIKGQAVLEARRELKDFIQFIQAINTEKSTLHKHKIEKSLDTVNHALTPILLAAGAAMCWIGTTERAIGLLQFTPINSWKSTKASSRLTALTSLKLQGVHINNAHALIALGKSRHVVVSRSCLERMGGIKVRERIHSESSLKKGELLRILAGIQNYLLDTNQIRVWSNQLNAIPYPAKVISINIKCLLTEGWQIGMEDGRQLTVNEQERPPSHAQQTLLDPLVIRENGKTLGHIELIMKPNQKWTGVCQMLEQLGMQVHIVGAENTARMLEISRPLEVEQEILLHSDFKQADRMKLVQSLQRGGEGVIYLGDLLCDMPALTIADVSIGIDSNLDNTVTGSICDICLDTNALWLPHIIQLSRQIEKTEKSNFAIISGISLLTAIAATAAWIAPLPTVLLANIPIFIAELRNIYAISSHGMLEIQEKQT